MIKTALILYSVMLVSAMIFAGCIQPKPETGIPQPVETTKSVTTQAVTTNTTATTVVVSTTSIWFSVTPVPTQGGGTTIPQVVTSKNNVTFSIDQKVYRVGEVVNGRLVFNGTLWVYPLMIINKLDNGNWTWLGYHTFDGLPYLSGAFPPCQQVQASDSPIFLSWNSTGPGTYRIIVTSDTNWYCLGQSIEAEFTVR
jgi:hypothetical protein